MVPIEMLSPGMRVKIVDQWNDQCFQNNRGLMDKYLGQVVTVLDVHGCSVRIEEDAGDCEFQEGGHWSWGAFCFDCIVVEDETWEDFEIADISEIFSLLYGIGKGG